MKTLWIFGNDDVILGLENKSMNINHISGIFGINKLIKNIIDCFEGIKNKDNTFLVFSKPNYNLIELQSTDKNFIYFDKRKHHDNDFFNKYIEFTTSEDGKYERQIIDIKFDYLINFLNVENINYKIIEEDSKHDLIEYIDSFNKKII